MWPGEQAEGTLRVRRVVVSGRLIPATKTKHSIRDAPLPAPIAESLRELGRNVGATLFMTLLAGFKALLARYTGEEDVVIGTPIASRNHLELESIVGFFANTLVLRTDLSGDPTFRQLLGRVRDRRCCRPLGRGAETVDELVDPGSAERGTSGRGQQLAPGRLHVLTGRGLTAPG